MELSLPRPQPPALQPRSSPQVVVEHAAFDVNHPEFNTLRFLGFQSEEPPGTSIKTIEAFFDLIVRREYLSTRYACPLGMVRAEHPTPAFLTAARKLQSAWRRQMKDKLGSSSRLKRAFKSLDPINRQLHFTGVMIINGKHVLPHRWPLPSDQQMIKPIRGKRYGRLEVLDTLSKGRCLCRCDCGKQAIVRRKHLVAGRTQSCGCLRAEFDKRQHDRKRNQSWMRSGQLSL